MDSASSLSSHYQLVGISTNPLSCLKHHAVFQHLIIQNMSQAGGIVCHCVKSYNNVFESVNETFYIASAFSHKDSCELKEKDALIFGINSRQYALALDESLK